MDLTKEQIEILVDALKSIANSTPVYKKSKGRIWAEYDYVCNLYRTAYSALDKCNIEWRNE